MTRLGTVTATLTALALSACGQGGQGAVGLALSGVSNAKPAPAATLVALSSDTTLFSLADRNAAFMAVPVEKDGDVTVWSSADGTLVAIRNGMLIWTRGFGQDVMSAQVPTGAELIGGAASHKRVYHFVDGADSPVRRSFDCTVSPATTVAGPRTAHHVIEICTGPAGKIANEFWLDAAGSVVESRQWAGELNGHVGFRRDGK